MTMTHAAWKMMIEIMKQDVIPATGCTEPVSIAFAAATAARHLGEPVQSIDARVSANLMKNGMGVMVPGTGRPGLHIAAAVGAFGGDPDKGLQVLSGISQDIVDQGAAMVDAGKVTVQIAKEVPYVLYSEATVKGTVHTVTVCVANSHTHVISIEKDGQSVFKAVETGSDDGQNKIAFLQSLCIADIVDFAEHVLMEDVAFMKEAEVLNDRLSKEGLTGKYGLHIAASLVKQQESGLIGKDLQTQVLIRTVSAADARMGGAPFPAMTNSGSGNQGISATQPVVVIADYVKASAEDRLRAIVLSHMTAIYAHAFLPKLSAFCATVTASMGAAAGMAWLMNREHAVETISRAICSMAGEAAGMVCDGAANSCAMKVATACTSAFRSVLLALEGTRVSGHDGLVAFDVNESIRNVGCLACHGMQQTDDEVLKIMMHKNQEQC